MSEDNLLIRDRASHVRDLGYPSDNSIPTSLSVTIEPREQLALQIRITSITLKRPWVRIINNPRVDRVPWGPYECHFSAGTETKEVSSSDVLAPSSPQFGKLLQGFSLALHEGQPELGQTIQKSFGEDPLRDMRFCGRYVRSSGVVSGVLSMNPGWKYTHNRRNPHTGSWEYAHLELAYPKILTLGTPTVLAGRTVIELRHQYSESVATPDGSWQYDAYNYATVPRYRLPGWEQEYALRQVGLQVGSDIRGGISLCHSYYHVPRRRPNDPNTSPPVTRSLQFESKVTVHIDVT